MRVYCSISSEGFGHSSRALALAKQFEPGAFLVGSYGQALRRIQRNGVARVAVPQEIKLEGKAGGFDMGQTILSNPARALSFNQIVEREMDIMRSQDITLVVADGRMAPVVAASKLHIPCVVLTNQSAFYPFFARDTTLIKLLGLSFEMIMQFWLSSAEEILIPDFPPPFTVCQPNLSSHKRVKKRTRFVGPLVAWQADEVPPLDSSQTDRVVVSLGGHSYRRPVFDEVLQVARHFPSITFDMLCDFDPSGPVPDNVTLHGLVPDCSSFFKSARLVLTQAGHSTAMELLTLGVPSLIVPDSMQIEQENNAQRMVELGVSMKLTHDELEQGLMTSTVEAALETPSLRERSQAIAEQAKALNGSVQAANVLKEYAGRLKAY